MMAKFPHRKQTDVVEDRESSSEDEAQERLALGTGRLEQAIWECKRSHSLPKHVVSFGAHLTCCTDFRCKGPPVQTDHQNLQVMVDNPLQHPFVSSGEAQVQVQRYLRGWTEVYNRLITVAHQ